MSNLGFLKGIHSMIIFWTDLIFLDFSVSVTVFDFDLLVVPLVSFKQDHLVFLTKAYSAEQKP